MTVQMDNSSDQSSRERVQRLFNKNVELDNKRRKAAQARIPSDPNIWQQIRENYEAIILEDHAFSEQHEIEYALWQLQYRRIEELRTHFNAALASAGSTGSQNGKGPARGGPDRITKIRTQIKTFLSEATGFYHDLMLKIRAKYGLQLGYFSDDPESQISLSKDGAKSAEVKKGLISCHRCLIYLGDLARYKGLYGEGDSKARDFAAASSYYMQASSLLPSSGNPHHQLAILASYSGDELVAIYRYFRSLAVDTPFPTARDNLIIAFEKNRQSYSQLLGEAKTSTAKVKSTRMTGKGRGKSETRLPAKDNRGEVTVNERAPSVSEVYKAFSTRFVRLNGILFTRTSLETFTEVLSTAKNDLLELLSTGPDEEYNFGSDAADCRLAIVRLIAILIFTVHNVNKETESQSYAEILQRSVLLQSAFTAIFDFMGHILERCTQLTNPSVSYLLPGIMVFVEWLACHQDIAVGSELEEKQASARLYFWNHCITFLNKLIASGSTFLEKDEDETCFFNMSRYEEGETANRLALSEDFELRGFLPLVPAQLILDFSRKHSFGSDGGSKEKKTRIQRIIAAGKALANVVQVGEEGIYFDAKLKKFIIGSEPPISDDYPFTNSLEVPELSSMLQGNPAASQMSLGTLQPKPQLYMEGEEEDEVIVFKPSMTDKHVDGLASNLTSSAFLASGAAKVNLGNVGPVSAEFDGFLVQNASSTSLMLPTSVATSNVEYLQPINSSSSKWLVEQAPVVDGLANLNVMENGLAMKSESQNHSGVTQPAAFSVPFPHSLNLGLGSNYSVQVPENVVPSMFDSVISSGAGADSLSLKQSSWVSAGLKKNPGIRPLRHFGPPPGFGSVPPKFVDESSSAMTLKNENPSIRPMDDYRWLDGYQLPSSNPSNGLNNSLSSSVQSYHTVSKGNSSTGMLSFPFPGKQMSTMQVQMENPKGWQDYQLSEQLKLHQEQQKQLHRGNQQSVALPEQYGGQSLWEGRFFV